MDTHFIVRVSSAPVKGKARRFGSYIRLAVVEVDASVDRISAIDSRLRGVRRIVRRWGFDRALHLGITERSEGRRAISEANKLAKTMNARSRRKSVAAFDPCI